jgi:hypothetical protein
MSSSFEKVDLVKLCNRNQERNPFSRRCNTKCKSGYNRITNKNKRTFKCYKNCTNSNVRNPKTNRCTNKKGKSMRTNTMSKSFSASNYYLPIKKTKSKSKKSKSKKSKSKSKSVEFFFDNKIYSRDFYK